MNYFWHITVGMFTRPICILLNGDARGRGGGFSRLERSFSLSKWPVSATQTPIASLSSSRDTSSQYECDDALYASSRCLVMTKLSCRLRGD